MGRNINLQICKSLFINIAISFSEMHGRSHIIPLSSFFLAGVSYLTLMHRYVRHAIAMLLWYHSP